MLCKNCNRGRLKPQQGLYHYTECGLPNIYLENIEWHQCPKCGAKEARIPMIGQLHRCIAWRIVAKPALLSGKEIVFLRKMLGYPQNEFADLLGVSPVVLSRWETEARKHSAANDRLVRLVYLSLKNDEYTHKAHEEIHEALIEALIKFFGRIEPKVSTRKMRIDPRECSPAKELEETLAFCTALIGKGHSIRANA